MLDSELDQETFKNAMRDQVIRRVNKLSLEDLTELLGHLILQDRFRAS